jgi:hypothetical protein
LATDERCHECAGGGQVIDERDWRITDKLCPACRGSGLVGGIRAEALRVGDVARCMRGHLWRVRVKEPNGLIYTNRVDTGEQGMFVRAAGVYLVEGKGIEQ